MTTIRSIASRFVNLPLGALGVEIRRKQPSIPQNAMPHCDERLRHARDLGFSPKTIFDGGAFRGHWAREVAGLFPGAQLVVFEPNPFLQPILRENLSRIQPLPVIVEAALAAEAGTSLFNIWEDRESDMGASLLGHVRGDANTIVEVKVESVDGIIERLKRAPDLLKLDLQGAELLALKGAKRALEHTEVVIVEFGCLAAYDHRTTPRELLDLLYDAGFVLYDIVDCIYRPYDGALAAGDFFFVKNSSSLRRHKDWR